MEKTHRQPVLLEGTMDLIIIIIIIIIINFHFISSPLYIPDLHRVLVGKPEGKRPLGRLRRRWENNITISRYFCVYWRTFIIIYWYNTTGWIILNSGRNASEWTCQMISCFHIRTVHLYIIKVLSVHQLMHQWVVLKNNKGGWSSVKHNSGKIKHIML